MKKAIVVLLFLFLSNIYAQKALMKGAYTLGGNISYSSYSEEGDSENQNYFNFSPNVGYFFIDQFYTGIQLSYTYLSSGDYSSNTIGIGPEIRYYFILEKLNPFLGIGYSYNKSTSGDDDNENTNSTFTLSGGADYFVTDYFAIEGSIRYSFITYKFSSNNYSSKQNANQFVIGFGAKYFIF